LVGYNFGRNGVALFIVKQEKAEYSKVWPLNAKVRKCGMLF